MTMGILFVLMIVPFALYEAVTESQTAIDKE